MKLVEYKHLLVGLKTKNNRTDRKMKKKKKKKIKSLKIKCKPVKNKNSFHRLQKHANLLFRV